MCIHPFRSFQDEGLPPNYRPTERFQKLTGRRTDFDEVLKVIFEELDRLYEENGRLRRELAELDNGSVD